MISPSPFTSLIQAVAALAIFVIGYLALLLSVIFCLLFALLISKAARLLWSYAMRTVARAHRAPTPVPGNVPSPAHRIVAMIRLVATAQRSSP
jgi:hypothetical protein